MTTEENKTFQEEIREALKHCPSWHQVIMGNNGKGLSRAALSDAPND